MQDIGECQEECPFITIQTFYCDNDRQKVKCVFTNIIHIHAHIIHTNCTMRERWLTKAVQDLKMSTSSHRRGDRAVKVFSQYTSPRPPQHHQLRVCVISRPLQGALHYDSIKKWEQGCSNGECPASKVSQMC